MKIRAEFNPIRSILLLLLFSICGLKSFGQTDTEFWFVVPDVTSGHGSPGGTPANLTFSTFNMASKVTISMPADPSFTAMVIDIPAGTATSVSMDAFINKGAGVPNLENVFNTLNNNKCGLKITSTTPVTAYYQIANFYNTEIYALKGKNALGMHFYVPFQTIRSNGGGYSPKPYSSINIVATEDNTTINIKPTQNAYMHGVSIAKGTTKSIVLNKGQTVCVVPELSGGTPNLAGGAHLAGTEVSSDKNIAITTNDDSVSGIMGCGDTIGDQLVNTESLGKTYVVLKTMLAPGNKEDCYITAVEDNTTITVKNNDGSVSTTYTLNAGQQQEVVIDGSYCVIDADKKVSVFHIGGFGCELGGAILPAIDKCTGSTQVAFYKLTDAGKTFNTNIMVRDAGRDQFYLNGVKVDMRAAAGGKDWTNLPGTDWWFLQVTDWNTGKFASLKEDAGNILTNQGDLFHLGVFYGGGSNGCSYGYFSDFNEMVIAANVSGVESGETKVCFGEKIQLYAKGGTTYKWSPAEYLSDPNIFNPIANVPVTGIKQYEVAVSGACNLTKTVQINLQILPPVKANFSVDNITGCSPLTVNFTNTSLNAAKLEWSFGDGTKSSSSKFTPPGLVEQLNHVYVNTTNAPITFTVQLMVKNESACGDVVEKMITVYPSVEAKLNRIDPTPISYCSPRSVTFENTSPDTALPSTDITYIWDYGDGGSSKTDGKTNVTHDFSVLNMDKKRYDVSLTMINKFGCKSVDKDTIDVYGKVAAFFALDKNSGCPNPNFNAVLTDGSTGAIAKRTWNWNGFTNNPITASTYDISTSSTSATTTTHTITLDVEGAGGCKDSFKQDITLYPYVKAQFSIADATLCDGEALNIIKSPSPGATDFIWDFGDGSTSSEATANVTHLYNNATYAPVKYDVKLTAKSTEGGCQSTSVATPVTVYSRIDPNFSIVGLGGCAPFMANIVNTSKGNKDNTYSWDFDSDANFEIVNEKFVADFSREFTNTSAVLAGYNVTLKVANEGGCSKSTSGMALVYPKPTSGFTVDNALGCNPLPVKLTATTNVPEYSYTWSFGDGSTGSQPTVSHTYNNFDFTKDATYKPVLSVGSIYGCSTTAEQSITVHPLLKAAFTMEQLSLCTPFEVRITPRSLGATSYSWNYGDGRIPPAVTSSAPFNITYDNLTAAAATYNIGMVATNAAGACPSTASSVQVVVNPRVVANGSFTFDDKCTGVVAFKNTSTGGTSYTWDFGDGQSASTPTATDIKHTYENRTSSTKRFTATLTVVNANECAATKTFDVDVVPRVESAFTYTIKEKCTPMKIALVNSSLNGTEYKWEYGHTIGGVAQQEIRTSTDPFDKIFESESLNTVQDYTLKLTNTDKATGCFAESTKTLTIYPKIIPAITSTIVDNCKGGVTFKNTTTGATSYTWSFGDQTSSFSTDKLDDISHAYLNRSAASKIFNASMVASNAIGCSDITKKDVTIVPRVESAFTLEELDGCTPVKVKLTNTSLNGQLFTWDYGHTIGGVAQLDVKTDKLPFEKLIDNESDNDIKTYPIILTVVDKNTLCSSRDTIMFDVHPKLLPSFTADKLSGCSDLPVIFTNTSTGGVMSFDWDFNDGQSSKTGAVSETVAHTFTNRQAATQNYSVAMLATNSKGCRVEASKTIGVYPKVEAAFAFVQTSKCTPFPIDITNGSLNGTEYQWDFGHTFNGNRRDTVSKSKAGFRTYIYNDNSTNALTYTMSLTARDATTGCSDMVTKTIDAQPEVKSLFGLSVDKGCNPLTVSFTNNATGSTSYTWDFGNGTSSTSAAPATMVFSNTDTVKIKTYNISLASKNIDGCTNVTSKRVDVYPRIMGDFTLDKVNGCTPLAVKIVNSYPSSAYRYEWSLGSNGINSDQQIPPVNFINSSSSYSIQPENIKLKVYYKGDANCFKEVERMVEVYPSTLSDFSMDVTEACNPLVVNFTNNSKSFNSSTSYQWSFDKLGTSGEVNPKYTFGNLSRTLSESYTIKLKSTSIHGCNDFVSKTVVVRPIPKAQMAIATATGCAPFDVQVQNLSVGAMPIYSFWLDNDRANSVVRNGNTPVSFTIDNLNNIPKSTDVWLKAVSDFGCKDSISQKVFTNPHVTSAFTFSPSDAGCNPLTVNFVNTSTNGTLSTWDFNDGVTVSVDSPNHVFMNPDAVDKTFNVKLSMRSEYGCVHVSSKNFTVFSAPIAYFTIEPPLRTYPEASFIFNNKTTPKVASWNYEWTFGDGGKFVGVDPPVYTYKTWGDIKDDSKYYVTLKVSNGNCKNEATQFLYLKPAVPISMFTSSVISSCTPLETQLTHQAKYQNSIEWDFGDGTKSVEASPFHIYKVPGKYHVQLSVKGDGGTTYSYKTLDVFPNPTASFKLAPAEAMLPEAKVQFYNTSLEGAQFVWEFGDLLGTSTEKNPAYAYKKLGSYDVKLHVTSQNGCVDDTLVKAAVKVVGEGLLKFPNAFIPNAFGGNGGAYELPDYKNEVFHPISEGVVVYKLIIYNRWGEMLFSSNELTVGWDGYHKGKLSEQGVYVYRATGRYTNGKTFDIRGDVTLLR